MAKKKKKGRVGKERGSYSHDSLGVGHFLGINDHLGQEPPPMTVSPQATPPLASLWTDSITGCCGLCLLNVLLCGWAL